MLRFSGMSVNVIEIRDNLYDLATQYAKDVHCFLQAPHMLLYISYLFYFWNLEVAYPVA